MDDLIKRAYAFRRFDRDCKCPGLLRELAEALEKTQSSKDQRAPKGSHHCHGCGYYGYNHPGDREGWCKHPQAPKDEIVYPTDHCADFKAWEMPADERKTLPWEYCECGCKGWELKLGGTYFWMHWDLDKRWSLGTQHGMLYTKHVFKSTPEAESFVLTELATKLPKLQQDHQVITELLARHPQRQDKP